MRCCGCGAKTRRYAVSARERIVAAYWKPVYKYIRWKWRESNESAKDLTRLFAKSLRERCVRGLESQRPAAFRTFLRLCADRFVANHRQFASRLKRNAQRTEALDEASATDPFDCDEYLHREWIRQVFAHAIAALRDEYSARGREQAFRAFERYDLAVEETRPSYAELALEIGVSSTQVTNYLAAARRDLRRIVLEKLRELTATDREYQSEARAVLGIEV